MAINRASIAKELLPGLNAVFGLEYGEVDNEHEPLFDVENSDRAFEEEVLFTGFGTAPVKGEGAAVTYDQANESYVSRYVNETISLAFAVTEEAMEDNLYDSLSSRYTKALARAMAYTKQVKAAYPLNNGFTNTYQSGDGVNLFTADGDGVAGGDGHPLVNGGKNSNRPVTAADLNETSLEAAIIDISGYTDERGLLVAGRARKLIVPSNLMFVAQRILATDLRPNTADNDINAIKSLGVIPDGYSVNHYLTDTNAWFLLTDIPNGMKHFVRTPLETGMDGDFDTGNVRYRARERYSFGVSDPLGIYGSPGSS